jgi:hypothetical protein
VSVCLVSCSNISFMHCCSIFVELRNLYRYMLFIFRCRMRSTVDENLHPKKSNQIACSVRIHSEQ